MSDRFSEIQLVFDALGKEGAVQVLASLRDSSKSQKEIAKETGLSTSRVSICVNELRQSGAAVQDGLRNARIDVSHIADEIDQLLESASNFRRRSAASVVDRLAEPS